MRIIYLISSIALMFILTSCKKNITEPEHEELVFYKYIDTLLFLGDITASLTTYKDTVVDNQGYLKVIELPEIIIETIDNKFGVKEEGYFYISFDKIEYLKQDFGYSAGSYLTFNKKLYSYKLKVDHPNKVYIRFASQNNIVFELGVNVK